MNLALSDHNVLTLSEALAGDGHKPANALHVLREYWGRDGSLDVNLLDISKAARGFLQDKFIARHSHIARRHASADGTIKNAVMLHDGLIVESVLIPTEKRITACVSSQVGCSLACKFCATARLKRMRNLNPDEIYDQVVAIQQQCETFFGRPLTNIVFMGMGEPLLNFKNLERAFEILYEKYPNSSLLISSKGPSIDY